MRIVGWSNISITSLGSALVPASGDFLCATDLENLLLGRVEEFSFTRAYVTPNMHLAKLNVPTLY